MADLLASVPVWVFHLCTLLLVLGPFVGRAAVVICEAMGWTRVAEAAHRAAPFARGFLSALLRASGRAAPGVLLLVLVSGCTGVRDQIRSGLEAARDVASVATPCLESARDLERSACQGNGPCLDRVSAEWLPVESALAVFHRVWCDLAPESEGCEQ